MSASSSTWALILIQIATRATKILALQSITADPAKSLLRITNTQIMEMRLNILLMSQNAKWRVIFVAYAMD